MRLNALFEGFQPQNMFLFSMKYSYLLMAKITPDVNKCNFSMMWKSYCRWFSFVVTKTANHPKPPETTRKHLQPPETIHNPKKPSTRNHLQSLRTILYHPKPPTTSQNLNRTSCNWSETIHIHLKTTRYYHNAMKP